MQTHYPVVICGAGPTGLMLSAQLTRFNISFLIIDKKAGPTTESRAVVVQARSMEIYEQLGLSDEILADSLKANGLCFWRHGKKVGEFEFDDMGSDITPFYYVIMYEQSKNENLLYRYLQSNNQDVEWNTELVAYREGVGKYIVTLQQQEKQIEITADYMVACDGARSKLRELTAMEFAGGTYENVFYVADTHVQKEVCSTSINFFVSNNAFHLLFPLEGKNRYRTIGILPKKLYHKNDISFTEVSEHIQHDAETDLGFYNTQWYSTYRLHHKKIQQFNKGNIFFCGDAAHVHSPAGGQGMNTGLQDAYNLAWKLALVINEQAKESLLHTYHEERNPVAESLLNTTDRMFGIMSKNDKLDVFLRMYLMPTVMPALMKMQFARRQFFKLLSQTEIAYTGSSLSKGKAGKIHAGMRFPYMQLLINGEMISVFQLIRQNAVKPFLLITYNVPVTVLPGGLFNILEIEKNEENDTALHDVGFSPNFTCLLRPDNYIGFIDEGFDANAIDEYLQL